MAMKKERFFSFQSRELQKQSGNGHASAARKEGDEEPCVPQQVVVSVDPEESLFVEDGDIAEIPIHNETTAPNVQSRSDSSQDSEDRMSQIGYELFKSQLESIIGNASTRIIQYLHEKYFNQPNYIQLAADEYFQGLESNWNTQNTQRSTKSLSRDESLSSAQGQQQVDEVMQSMITQHQLDVAEKQNNSWKRYIGTLDVEAWATRPYLRPLAYQQRLEIKRLRPNKIKKSSIVSAKFGDSAIIRLYTVPDGREIGRLPEDVTRILSPLIDLDLANFEAIVMMETSRRLSIGDSFFLNIRCYLNNNTFAHHAQFVSTEDTPSESPSKRRKSVKSSSSAFSSESEGEAALRLKQRSISRLFEKLQITKYDSAAERSIISDDEDKNSRDNSPKPDLSAPSDQLDLDQLKQFYSSNQESDYLDNLPETTTPPSENFKLSLRPYQKHGLAWMLSREKELDLLETLSATNEERLSTQKMQSIRDPEHGVMNPLWSAFKWPVDPVNSSNSLQQDEFFYANLYNGEFSTAKPVVQSFLRGGILADEMGLGKTISTLALVHSAPYDSENKGSSHRPYASKSTLIVVPMSLLSQWKTEFERTNNNPNHRCFVYYGESMQTDLYHMLCNRTQNIPIVILTTYGTVQNEWARINKQRDEMGNLPMIGLYSVEFLRIVLDEGHTIRNRATKTAKSIHELESQRKWILTGTPVINRLDDLFSPVKFFKLDPWSNFSYWKTFVTIPFEQKKFNQTLDVIKSILQPIFLRRTKNMKQKDGTPLVYLPEKEVVIQEVEFSPRETMMYEFFKSRAYQSFKEGIKSGTLMKRYTQILTHILRLRQICCHSDLVASSNELDDVWEEELTKFEAPLAHEKFKSETEMKKIMYALYKRVNIQDSECSICTSSPISWGELTLTECGHQYCFHCLADHIKFQTENKTDVRCPDCRQPISRYRLFKILRKETTKREVRFHTKEEIDDPSSTYPFQIYHYNPDRTSIKIEALIAHLRELREQSPGEQVVVFSQFSTFLDLIENEIKSLGTGNEQDFDVFKFDGRLNMVEREKILNKFTSRSKAEGRISVLLLSLKAGGVGLNLTVAKRAFMMDPWWSPSIEDQAIDRVHRIGQDQNVKVVRFIVKNSIETKMLRIQERKRMMGEAVEVEEEERRKQRLEEIKLLFDD